MPSFTLPTPPASVAPSVLPLPSAIASAPISAPTLVSTAEPTAGQDSELSRLDAQIAANEEKLKTLTNPLMKKNVVQALESLRAQRAKLL